MSDSAASAPGPEPTDPPPGRRRGIRRPAVLTTAIVGVLILAFVPVWYFFIRGVPLIDEWVCSQGEAPTVLADGGVTCEKFTSFDQPPPRGEWDPLGNRPFSCHHRFGWTEVRRVSGAENAGDRPVQCLKSDRAIPDGFEKVG